MLYSAGPLSSKKKSKCRRLCTNLRMVQCTQHLANIFWKHFIRGRQAIFQSLCPFLCWQLNQGCTLHTIAKQAQNALSTFQPICLMSSYLYRRFHFNILSVARHFKGAIRSQDPNSCHELSHTQQTHDEVKNDIFIQIYLSL